MKISGIYKIESKIKTERLYIGSALNIKDRWYNHLGMLRKGNHHSIKLQNHFNKYGEQDLIFIILEPCLPEFLIIREQYYINKLKPWFNICKVAGSLLGLPAWNKDKKIGWSWMQGKHHSAESNKKNSEAHKGIIPSNAFKKGQIPWMKGKRHSKESIQKMEESHKGQIPWNIGLKCPHIGVSRTEETRKKISKSKKGKTPWNKGLKYNKLKIV